MAISIVKETIELPQVVTDGDGSAFLTKRINLKEGFRHQLVQVDMFEDAYASEQVEIETVISPYPAIPTNMAYSVSAGFNTRYPAGGDDSVLFKERRSLRFNFADLSNETQFPSSEIASMNAAQFYSDHVYINMHLMTLNPETTVTNIAFSFLMVLDDKKVGLLEHTLGVLKESHDAMCALVMSNGHMNSLSDLRGNTFPTWRFGGILPENMVNPAAANSFFLKISTRDAEVMQTSTEVRNQVADARQMTPFDQAYGVRNPPWLRMDLNQGLMAGPIRADAVPLKYADNGNTRMF